MPEIEPSRWPSGRVLVVSCVGLVGRSSVCPSQSRVRAVGT